MTAQYFESLKDAFLKKKGIPPYELYKYKNYFSFGSGDFNEEFTKWAYSDEDKELKTEIFKSVYIKIMKMQPKENYIVNFADIRL